MNATRWRAIVALVFIVALVLQILLFPNTDYFFVAEGPSPFM